MSSFNNENRSHGTADVIRYVVHAYPKRTATAVVLLVLSGLAEGLGIATLLPLLEMATRSSSPMGGISRAVSDMFAMANIQPDLPVLLVVLVTAITGKSLLALLASREVGYAVAGVMTDLRTRMLEGVAFARWPYIAKLESGRLANAIGIEALRAANLFNAVAQIFASFVQVLVYAITVTLLSWQVALAGLLCGGFLALIFRRFVRHGREASNAQTEMMKEASNQLTEFLINLKPLKSMGTELNYVTDIARRFQELNVAHRKQIVSMEFVRLMQEPMAVGVLAVGLYVFVDVMGVAMSAMMVTALLFFRLLGRIGAMQQTYQVIANGESAYWSLATLIDSATGERERDKQADIRTIVFSDHIAFSHIAFSYTEEPVIVDATFAIGFGEYVCLRGESGAGKSTLGDLLLRLMEPTSGDIFVDGQRLDELELRAWRHRIGYVPQEPALFSGSIFDNVAMKSPTYSRDQVRQALEESGAWEFVAALPQGMDSVLGDRGTGLSGGQRQRIAIARALVRTPLLLILDEVTASLDPQTEAGIVATLHALKQRVTILAISHQPAVAAAADREFVVAKGRVLEIVTPASTVGMEQ